MRSKQAPATSPPTANSFVVSTEPTSFHGVSDALTAKGYAIESSEIAMVPKNLVKLDPADGARSC